MEGLPTPSSTSIYVDILTPAFIYPASLSRTEIISNSQRELGVNSDDCCFFNIDNERIGCLLKNSRFTMEYVERQYHHSILLSEQLERAAEALKTFQDKLKQDEELILNLRGQIEELKSAVAHEASKASDSTAPIVTPTTPLQTSSTEDIIDWKAKYEEEVATRRNLQEKLQKLKSHTNHVNSEVTHETEHQDTVPKPKVTVPKLPLGLSIKLGAPTSPNVLRSKSSSDIIASEERVVPSPTAIPSHLQFPPQQEQEFSNFTNSFSLDEKAFGAKRRNTIANLKPFGDPPLELSLPQEALSQCRLCSCDVFRATQKAGWICLCGHTSIKHANIPYKLSQISPRAMSPSSRGSLSPRSPRAFGGL